MKWIGKHPVYTDLLIDNVFIQTDPAGAAYDLTLPPNDGSSGQVLTTDGSGVLTWTTPSTSGGTVTSVNVSGGSTGLTTSGGPITSSGTITMGGTLAVGSGGTGLGTVGVNEILTGNGTSPLTSESTLTYDGTVKTLKVLNTTTDYFSLSTGASGETTINTVDGGGSNNADLNFNVQGDATFNVLGRNFDILWGLNNMAGFALQTVKLGHTDSTAYNINRNPTPAGVAGGDLNFNSGYAPSGTNLRGGNMTWLNGASYGDKNVGSYIWMGGVNAVALGGSATDMVNGGRPGELWTLQSGPATTPTDGVFQATLHSPESPSKHLNFKCGWNGVSTISTTDASSGTNLADLTLDVDGDITLDTANGKIDLKLDGSATPATLLPSPSGGLEINATADVTIDTTGDIELNADGGDIYLKDGTSIMVQFQDGITTLGGDGSNGSRIQFNDADDTHYIRLQVPATVTTSQAIDLPEDSGTVALQERHKHIINMGFSNTSLSPFFLPLIGYPFESTSVASYTSQFTAPYDGKVIKVGPGWCTGTGNKTVAYKLYKNRQTTTQTGTTNTTSSFTTTVPEVTPTDWTFSKGDVIGIQADAASSTFGSVGLTVTLELDTTT